VEIQAACDRVDADGHGTVILGCGHFVGGQLIAPRYARLIAASGTYATLYQAKAALNAYVLTNRVSPDGIQPNAQFVEVGGFVIDGNKANQASGGGVFWSMSPATGAGATGDVLDGALHNSLRDMVLYNCKQNGYDSTNYGENRLHNVVAFKCDGHGFNPGYDSFFSVCTSAWSGLAGYRLGFSTCHLAGCKAYYSGQVTPTQGYGFWHRGAGYGHALAACIAQDNKATGFIWDSGANHCTAVGCVADSNSTRGAGLNAGFQAFQSDYNTIFGAAFERRVDGATSYQTHALQIDAASDHNVIILTHGGENGATLGSSLLSSDLSGGNIIVINGEMYLNALPTADPHVAGQVWRNSGVLTVSAG